MSFISSGSPWSPGVGRHRERRVSERSRKTPVHNLRKRLCNQLETHPPRQIQQPDRGEKTPGRNSLPRLFRDCPETVERFYPRPLRGWSQMIHPWPIPKPKDRRAVGRVGNDRRHHPAIRRMRPVSRMSKTLSAECQQLSRTLSFQPSSCMALHRQGPIHDQRYETAGPAPHRPRTRRISRRARRHALPVEVSQRRTKRIPRRPTRQIPMERNRGLGRTTDGRAGSMTCLRQPVLLDARA